MTVPTVAMAVTVAMSFRDPQRTEIGLDPVDGTLLVLR